VVCVSSTTGFIVKTTKTKRPKPDLADALLLLDRYFSSESRKRHIAPDERALWFGVVDYGVGTRWGTQPPRPNRLVRIELKRQEKEK
jgi:hypothetical protein